MLVEITSKGGDLTVTTLKDGLILEYHDIGKSGEFDLEIYDIIAVAPQLRSPPASATKSASTQSSEHVVPSSEEQLSFEFLTE